MGSADISRELNLLQAQLETIQSDLVKARHQAEDLRSFQMSHQNVSEAVVMDLDYWRNQLNNGAVDAQRVKSYGRYSQAMASLLDQGKTRLIARDQEYQTITRIRRIHQSKIEDLEAREAILKRAIGQSLSDLAGARLMEASNV